jgi:hypothetical protein
MRTLEFHPLAELFPLVEGEEFAELVADISEHGLHEPIVLYEDRILDGRNRYRACLESGVEPAFETYTSNNPLGYVISLNLRRRHLDKSQRAMVAAKLATMGRGRPSKNSPIGKISQEQAAELLNVGKRSVERAREVQEHGAPELVRAVEQGAVSVSAAADVATLQAPEQREIIARGERGILKAAQAIRARKAEQHRADWTVRVLEISNQNAPLPHDRRYPIVLADPPWKFDVYDAESGLDRAAAAHYPTMELEEICKLPVRDLITPDAALFLWTTARHLQPSRSQPRGALNTKQIWFG